VGRPWYMAIPDDATMDPESGLLFQYAYSEEFNEQHGNWNAVRLIREFRAGYGGFIPCPSLRHAIIAMAASYLPPVQFQKHFLAHIKQASHALTKVDVGKIEGGDLLAAAILSYLCDETESRIHYDEMCSILDHLSSPRAEKGHTLDIFTYFRPIFSQWMIYRWFWSLDEFKSRAPLYSMVLAQLPTFAEVMQSSRRLYGYVPFGESKSIMSVVEVANALLFGVRQMLISLQLARAKEQEQTTEWDMYLNSMRAKWKECYGSPECLEIHRICEAALEKSDFSWVDNQFVSVCCVLYLLIRLLLHLLDGNTILEALCAPETVSTARKLITFMDISESVLRACCSPAYSSMFRGILFLGGSVLPMSRSTMSTYSS
jgi:hypothetical protein